MRSLLPWVVVGVLCGVGCDEQGGSKTPDLSIAELSTPRPDLEGLPDGRAPDGTPADDARRDAPTVGDASSDGGIAPDLLAPDLLAPDLLAPDLIPAQPPVTFPRGAISASELALVINDSDPISVEVGAYYQAQRNIPAANVVHVTLPTGAIVTSAQFQLAKDAVDAALGAQVQAIALAWMKPYRVECMSITTAFALGFDDTKYCSTPCSSTAASPYYNTASTAPFTDHALRPTMMLAGVTAADAKAVIDRGLAADGTFPTGKGTFIRTTDVNRSVRWGDFNNTVNSWNRADGIASEYIDNSDGSGSNVIANQADVLFYLTGLTTVPSIETNTYLPGAVADHLTSAGGKLDGTNQMSIMRWLEAGATASYGTCVEPCNYSAKFPRASVLLRHYFGGNTLIEAYWKSVNWPGEGVFVGEPLARPWGSKVDYAGTQMTITTTIFEPGKSYALEGQSATTGQWETVLGNVSVTEPKREQLVVDPMAHVAYRLVVLP